LILEAKSSQCSLVASTRNNNNSPTEGDTKSFWIAKCLNKIKDLCGWLEDTIIYEHFSIPLKLSANFKETGWGGLINYFFNLH
jgi:hypothetical protein